MAAGSDDDDYVHVSLRLSELIDADDDEPSQFVFRSEGTIELQRQGADDEESGETIGRFSVINVDVCGAVSEGVSTFDVFDSEAELFAIYESLYDGDNWKPAVMHVAFEEPEHWAPDLLVIEYVLIQARHRGNGYGLVATRALLHRFRTGANGLSVVEPVPAQDWHRFLTDRTIQERHSYRLDEFATRGERATAKLRSHFARLGFARVPKTPYMVLQTDSPLPEVHSLYVSRAGRVRDLSHLPELSMPSNVVQLRPPDGAGDPRP